MTMARFLMAVLLAAAMHAALAFDRPFPAHAKRGKMTPGAFPQVTMDGKPRQLAPGARIFNEENLQEMPAALRGRELPVNYTEDEAGEIDRVWLLTQDEAARPLPKPAKPAPP